MESSLFTNDSKSLVWEEVLFQSNWNHLLGKSMDEMMSDYLNPFSKFHNNEEKEFEEYIRKNELEYLYYNDDFELYNYNYPNNYDEEQVDDEYRDDENYLTDSDEDLDEEYPDDY